MFTALSVLLTSSLAALVAHCAPAVGPITMRSIIVYESGARAYAIGDNTTRRSYAPVSHDAAVELATLLVRSGHDIDIGYAQINIANIRAYGLDLFTALEPCTNVRLGAAILRGDYARAVVRYGPGQVALFHALSAYNTGGFFAGLTYAHGVYATAALIARRVP